ncbi:uracil-DNA glycosylase [Undibacterium fentianense]|uniref:Uracil-DNA glycosylase n=1 Tax=Undibacterium fentianense TaxID=2828728 RepID=A0A941DZY9_9BURK|nr:uracil-DNA glycosylase [Undibacterium fentianense]MBR7798416.1 uracil-DNA glycosylase [Undibacterium fentianense]
MPFPDFFRADIDMADVSWQAILERGLSAIEQINPNYLANLAKSDFLPTEHRLFAAFSIPLPSVRYVLVGEGPYPRIQSATGYCFMDGAVDALWSCGAQLGLSKSVNRATSLRNFIKMLLVADGRLVATSTSGIAMAECCCKLHQESSMIIQTMNDLQQNFLRNGFLMLNASLVFRESVSPAVDAKAWIPFFRVILEALSGQQSLARLILWGKIADRLDAFTETALFPTSRAEHPYNLSFIANNDMHNLFAPMRLLYR